MKNILKSKKVLSVLAALIVLISVQIGWSTSVPDKDKFKYYQLAFRYWLQKATFIGSESVSTKEAMNYLDLAPIALDAILNNPNGQWKIYYTANYDPFTGAEVAPYYKEVVVKQNMEKKYVLTSGYYFISKGDPKTGPHLVVAPQFDYFYSPIESVYFTYYKAAVYYGPENKAVADEFMADVNSYVSGTNNPYQGQVLEFGGDYEDLYSDGFQLRFLGNVHELNFKWQDLILEPSLKQLSYDNSEGFLKLVPEFEKFGIGAKKGLILEGPPGTGKSFMGQILMSSIFNGDLKDNVTMIMVTARHLKYANSIKTMFEEAQRLAPAIIFIEDIDLLGVKKRDGSGQSATGREEILNEFLNGIDGVVDNKGILVIATTNKINEVDEALLRSERLGVHIHFGLPSYEERVEFFTQFGFKGSVWEEGLTSNWLAARTESLSGADIIEIIGIAKQIALIEESWQGQKLYLKTAHFVEAIKRVRENHGDSGGPYFKGVTPRKERDLYQTMLKWGFVN